MHLLQNLTPSEVSAICLLIAVVCLFLAIILTIIHYTTRLIAGFALGLAAGAQGYWPMMQEWARDVLIPVVIGLGSLLVWGVAQLWERFRETGIDEIVDRF